MQRSVAGSVDGQVVERLVLANGELTVGLVTAGAAIHTLLVPDRNGTPVDVVLGLDDPTDYLRPHPYFGSVVGRYANRVAGGTFDLDGQTYHLDVNQDGNCLHGGSAGFHLQLWDAEVADDGHEVAVTMSRTSPDGEMGFPGALHARVTYTLRGRDLSLRFTASTDRPTVVNLASHVYVNLAGGGTVEDHELHIPASHITAVDDHLIPTGEFAPVAGTPMDFRSPKRIGADLRAADEQLLRAQGYDHNWVLDAPADGELRRAARVRDPASGRVLEVLTDQPGLQFYSGNFLDGTVVGKGGTAYRQGDALCLETQHFPDSPNQPTFPSTVLRPGETYDTTTVFRFSCGAVR